MLKRCLLAAAILCVSAVSAQTKQVVLDKVVAVVGGSSIFYSEISDYADQLKEQRRAMGYTSDRDPLNEALEQLMLQKLLYNQAQIDSVAINKGDILQNIESHIQNLADHAGSISALEAREHMPIFTLKEFLRQKYEEGAYASAMQGEVVGKITITPGEVERYYKSLDKDSLPMIAEQYVYAQITKFPKSKNDAKQRAREKLLDMREKIITGKARFDVMARMYSGDESFARGGEMEPQVLDGFVQPFAAALADLKPGKISEVVETQYGYHLIQLIDKKGNLYHCRHILIRPSYTVEESVEPSRFLDSIARLIRKDSITFEKAAMKFSDDGNSKMNGGIVTNHDILEYSGNYDARRTQTQFLKEDFGSRNGGGGKSLYDYNAIRNLKVGEVSDAFPVNEGTEQLSKIVKLISVIPPHKVSLEEDYLRIEAMALEAKKEKAFQIWLNKKIDGMYVYIAPEFRNGEFENKHWIK